MIQRHSFISRSLALLLLIAACGSVFLVFVEPLLRQERFYDDTLTGLMEQRARFAAEATALPQLRASVSAERDRPGPKYAYIDGETSSRAAASLLEKVKGSIQYGKATFVSAQVLSSAGSGTDDEQASTISVRAHMKARPESLQRTFHSIESGRPELFIRDVAITGTYVRKARPGSSNASESWEDLLLDVRFSVTGFRRPDLQEGERK